ncbi:MAG: glycosyltransferase family 1 protein [bacterium]
MRIGVNLVQYTDVQGIEIFAINMLHAAISDHTNDTFVLFVNDKSQKIFASLAAHNVVFVESPRGVLSRMRLLLLQQWWLAVSCKKNYIDILWCPSVAMPLWYKYKVVTIHDCADVRFPEEVSSFEAKIYLFLVHLSVKCRSLRVVTVSQFSQSEIAAVYSMLCNHIVVLSEGVPAIPAASENDRIWVEQKLGKKRKYFLYIGNIRPRKNIKNLLDAFALFIQKYPDISLVLAGKIDTTFFDVAAYSRCIHIENAVIQIGFVSDIEKSALYRGSIGFLFPSLYEGFGLPVLEAQSIGIPVLTSNVASLPEISGNGAIYVNPLDVKDIVRGIEIIFTDDAIRKTIIVAGYENIKRFSWSVGASQLMDVLHSTR